MVAHVVDGEDHRQVRKLRIGAVGRSQQHRHERALPVVTMNHVGLPDLLGQLDRRARELRETLGIVGVIPSGQAIELIAVEIFRIVHEEVLHAVRPRTFGNGRKAKRRTHGHGQALEHDFLDRRIAVTRQDHGHLVPQPTSALGSASTTSARPPVLENGKPSEATNRMRMGHLNQTFTVLNRAAPRQASGVSASNAETAFITPW